MWTDHGSATSPWRRRPGWSTPATRISASWCRPPSSPARDFNPDSQSLFVCDSKSGRSRHISLNAEGGKLFATLVAGKPPSALMFVREDGVAWEKNYHIRPMKDAITRANLGKEVTFHILRHSWASLAVMNGVPLMVVAANLGHTDTRMVEKHYGHLADSYKTQMIRERAPTFGIEADTGVTPLARRS